MKLEEAAALYRLGRATAGDLVDGALDALEKGADCQNMRELAGLIDPSIQEAERLFEAAMKDVGIAIPDEEAAERFLQKGG